MHVFILSETGRVAINLAHVEALVVSEKPDGTYYVAAALHAPGGDEVRALRMGFSTKEEAEKALQTLLQQPGTSGAVRTLQA